MMQRAFQRVPKLSKPFSTLSSTSSAGRASDIPPPPPRAKAALPKRSWKDDPVPSWPTRWRPYGEDGTVECLLSPRHCKIKPGRKGFCGVRGNVDGKLVTYNYGYSVQAAEERVETEAVYHYMPGAKILSLGNIGCMMNCTFCHNWETSQVKYLDEKNVNHYKPEEIVEAAVKGGIPIISWTYNDPVVWHEFVMDTSRLAQKAGIKTLYKSAFYIDKDAAKELTEVIDVFSLSLKSMSDDYYRKVCKGRLQPVLDAIEVVHKSGKHMEISQLLVTDLNDKENEMVDTVKYMKSLSPDIPLHFVRFHPAYKYMHVGRTPIEKLHRAKQIAVEAGIKHVYLGNVYEDGVSDTHCANCKTKLVRRFGMMTEVVGITPEKQCRSCGAPSPIHELATVKQVSAPPSAATASVLDKVLYFEWNSEVNSIHVKKPAGSKIHLAVQVLRQPSHNAEMLHMVPNVDRAIISKASKDETGVHVRFSSQSGVDFLPVLDRAHFPVSTDVYATPQN